MKARVSNLHKTEAEWAKLSNWVPEAGELVVYDSDRQHDYARLKVGDGEKSLKELPFFIDSAVNTILQKNRHQEVIDGGRITMYTN
jgi:hypothetical protein